ncbi:WD repeat-containing protein 62-like [Argonauta hians]
MDKPSISRKVIRSPILRRKKNTVPVDQRVTLEKVLGLTISSTAGLTCDPNTGAIAYPAGCVITIFYPRRNKQTHIFNASKKTITSVAFSGDGKYLVSGESGHQPAVRVWDVEEKVQVAQFQGHKFGINCVAYSPNMKYIVSMGTQHDMIVNVWNWKTNNKVASNKISSKVSAVAFSADGSYFVTVGSRHVKFWYMASSNTKPKRPGSMINETVPLMGRSGILGEQKNNFFKDVACGKGSMASYTYTITLSGLLCEFNEKRLLEKWVELRAKNATGMSVGEDYVFIGCANGVIRVFDSHNLQFVASLPKPHYLGVDVSSAVNISQVCPQHDALYPDSMALTYDDINKKITCVYSDHSLYIWDVHDIHKVGKTWSSLYHSGCIWDLEIYPAGDKNQKSSRLPPGSFITCSNDDTIRVWNINQHVAELGPYRRNIYSHELLKTHYTDPCYSCLCDGDSISGGSGGEKSEGKEGKNGIRSIKISPDGQCLASGDRMGNIRIYDLAEMIETKAIEAHDAEVLSLEYSPLHTEPRLLATASRDRLIHIFDVEQDYGLLQTLDDHSSSITAVKFTKNDGQFRMLSCSADKSLLFRNAQLHPEFQFHLHQHLVGKTTLYDMDVDATEKFVATACQDRNVRIYNIKSAKLKKIYKGSVSDDGVLIKLQLDPSGTFIATSCSDKNLSIFDFYTGELLANFYGHSEIATSLKFTNDLKHLISVSGDGCIFVWRLSPQLTKQMLMRMEEKGNLPQQQLNGTSIPLQRTAVHPVTPIRPTSFTETDGDCGAEIFPLQRNSDFVTSSPTNGYGNDIAPLPVFLHDGVVKNSIDGGEMTHSGGGGAGFDISIGQLPSWAKPKIDNQGVTSDLPQSPTQPRGRWAQRVDNNSMRLVLDGNQNVNSTEIKGYRQVAYNTDIVLEEDSSQSQVDSQNNSIISFDDQTESADIEDDDDEDFRPSMKTLESKSVNSGGTNDSNSERDNLSFEEIDDIDSASDNSDVIYMPNNDLESPENVPSNFQVFAPSSRSILIPNTNRVSLSNNVPGESPDQQGNDDGDEDEDLVDEAGSSLSNTDTPTEVDKELMWKTPEKTFVKDNFESLSFSPTNTDHFLQKLDVLEQEMQDNLHYCTPRLSISARFLSRSQPAGVKNLALYNSIQRQDNWYDLGWKSDHVSSPEILVKETPPKTDFVPGKLNFSECSPKRSRDREVVHDRINSHRERTSSGSSSGRSCPESNGKSGPGNQTPTRPVRRSWSTMDLTQSSPADLSAQHFGRMQHQSPAKRSTSPKPLSKYVSLFELRIDENEEETPESPSRKSVKSKLALSSKKSKGDRYSIATTEASKAVTNLRSQSSYSQQTKSSMAKMNKNSLYEAPPSRRDKQLSVYTKDGSDSSKTLKDPKKKKHKKGFLSSSMTPCLSVPNLMCIDDEDESLPPSNLQVLCDLSLSHSVPDVNVDDQDSQSSKASSDNPSSRNGPSTFPAEHTESSFGSPSKRRITIGCAPREARRSNKNLCDSDLMPPPLSTTLNSHKKDLQKRPLSRNRRPQTELTLDQAKNILLGKSGVLGKTSYKMPGHNPTPTTAEESSGQESDQPESSRSTNLNRYRSDSNERCSPMPGLSIGSDRPHSPALTSKVIAMGLRNREIKSKSHLGDLAPSPNDPPERDSPSKLNSTSPPTFQTNMGPKGTASKYQSSSPVSFHATANTATTTTHIDNTDSKRTSSVTPRKSSLSGNSTEQPPCDSGSKLLPSVKSKVAMFNATSNTTRRPSLEKHPPCVPRCIETLHGSDSDTEKEIKRPDKSRSHSPASLITNSHIISSPANVALTTPMESVPTSPKSESPLNLKNSPQSWDIPSKADKLEACRNVIKDLKLDVDKLSLMYEKVSNPEQSSQEILALLSEAIQETEQKMAGLTSRLSMTPRNKLSTRDISTSPILFPESPLSPPGITPTAPTTTSSSSSSSECVDVATATAAVSMDDKAVNTQGSDPEVATTSSSSTDCDHAEVATALVNLIEQKLGRNVPSEVHVMMRNFFHSFLQIVIYKNTH